MSVQRIRLWFRKGERVRYISHLDVLRYWERAFKRASIPLSYSAGFSPHPKLAFAGPLPLGYLSEAEIVDATLDERIALDDLRDRLAPQSSEDLALVDLREVPMSSPAPQSALTWADYDFTVPGVDLAQARAVVEEFLARDTFEWVEQRRDKEKTYDVRELVRHLAVEPAHDGVTFTARVSASQERNLRPDELLKALLPGEQASIFVRKALFLDEPSPAREAWRRRGRYAG